MKHREHATFTTETATSAAGASGPLALPQVGDLLAERYELIELKGSGSHGVVYRARDRVLRAEVALKILRPERAAEASSLERFRREALIARSLVSPNLVRIFDLASDTRWTFLTMEWVDGENLRDRSQREPLSLAQILDIAAGLLRGLETLHRAGVVHRDVKPANILLRLPFSNSDDVTLSDFGLALRLAPDATRATQDKAVLGTLAYLSPEQLRGSDASPSSDLYAVGLTVFQLLTGRLPGATDDELTTVLERLRLSERERDPRAFRPQTPHWLSAWVRHALGPTPEQRYGSATAALADLRLRRAPAFERRTRRVRLARAAAACGLIAALGIGGVVAWIRAPRFSHLRAVSTQGPGVEAIGTRGEVLWRIPNAHRDTSATSVLARLQRGSAPVLAMVVEAAGTPPNPDEFLELRFVAPISGEILRRVRLGYRPEVSQAFGNVGLTYHLRSLAAHDFDDDGVDEIIATYAHSPGWAGYAVLYEPHLDRSRAILVAGGHHEYQGVQDLDGDGREEILFQGISSLLGRYRTLVAVRLEPPVGEEPERHEIAVSSTPEMPVVTEEVGRPTVAWMALLDVPDNSVGLRSRAFAVAGGSIRLAYDGGGSSELDFDGLVPGISSARPADRVQWRDRAYRTFRDAQRFLVDDEPRNAVEATARGISLASQAGEVRLAEAMRRVQAKALLLAGDRQRAVAMFEELAATTDRASDIAYDAAETFDALGARRDAIAWYRRGLGKGAVDTTKNKVYFVLGAVRNLVALGAFEQAFAEVDRFERLYALGAGDYRTAVPRSWIHLQRGDPPAAWSGPLNLPVWGGDEETIRMVEELTAKRGASSR
jgi:tRNA A-37 threonylcarbamoyl transferase component Bud32